MAFSVRAAKYREPNLKKQRNPAKRIFRQLSGTDSGGFFDLGPGIAERDRPVEDELAFA